MTGVKISALPAASVANANDQLEVNQAGTSRRLTVGQISALAPGGSRDVIVDGLGAFNNGTNAAATTVAIQAAIDQVAAAGGGRVRFSAGTYLLQFNGTDSMSFGGVPTDVKYALKLKSGVTLEGIGDEVTELKLAPLQDATAMIKVAAGAANVKVRMLTLNGDKANQNFSGSLMGIRGASNVANGRYTDLMLKNFWGRALETNGDNDLLVDPLVNLATGVVVNKVKCQGNATKNIHIRRTDGAVVSECFITTEAIPDNNGTPPPGTIPNSDNASAYEASGSSNFVFDNNDAVHNTVDWGIGGRVVNGSQRGVISHLRSKGGRIGITTIDASHIRIHHNRVENSGAGNAGISIQCVGQNATVARNIMIDGNTIINCAVYGVNIGIVAPGTDLLDVMIVNNYIYDDGAGVMQNGLRNNAVGNITAYQSGNLIRGATVASTTGTFLPLDQNSGTWTPVLTFLTPGDLNVVYSAQVGTWVRDGNVIYWKLVVQTSTFTFTTAASDLRINGLPFLVKNDTNGRGLGYGSYRGVTKANFTTIVPLGVQNTTALGFQISGSGQTTANLGAADMPTGGTVRFEMAGFYETSAAF